MTENDEKVLCVPAIWARVVLETKGSDEETLSDLLERKRYRNRHAPNGNDPDVEHDDRWKQLIPYIVVVNSQGQILAYNRGSKGGEKRLENLWAIGVGGHVNNQDADWMAGVYREIQEELTCDEARSLDGPIGFLNDDSDDVGRHHLGVVYVLRADEVVPRENPEWTWSRLGLIERLVDKSPEKAENWARLALPMVRAWMEAN